MRIGRYKDMRITVWRDQNFDRYRDRDFLSETNFSDTNTETFFPRPNFPRPIPRLFFRDQIFQYRYRDFFNETKFFDTDTETFFRDQNFWYRYRDSQKIVTGLETETETFAYDWQLFTDNFLLISPLFFVTFSETKFRYRYRDFLETFFPIPIPRRLKNWQKSRDREVTL